MVTTKKLSIKNRTCYFYNDLINIKDFDPILLKLDKKSSMDGNIHYIGYVTKKLEYSFDSVNPLYLLIGEIDGFVEEENGSNTIALTDNNNEVLKKYAEVWSGIRYQIKKINDGLVGEYGKDYMKIKFDSDYILPLNTVLKFRILTNIIRNVFEKGGKYYIQIVLDDSLYEI